MSKLSKVFNILTIILSVIGFSIIFYSAVSRGAGKYELRMIGILFGLSLAVISFIISKSISDLNHLSNLKFLHSEVVDED